MENTEFRHNQPGHFESMEKLDELVKSYWKANGDKTIRTELEKNGIAPSSGDVEVWIRISKNVEERFVMCTSPEDYGVILK